MSCGTSSVPSGVPQNARCVHCVGGVRGFFLEDTLYTTSAMLHLPVPKPAEPRQRRENLREHWLTQVFAPSHRGSGHSLRGPRQRHSPKISKKYTAEGPQVRLPQRPSSPMGARTVLWSSTSTSGGRVARRKSRPEAKANTLRDGIGPDANITSLRFRGGSSRVFYVVSLDRRHGDIIGPRISRFLNAPWSRLFDFGCPKRGGRIYLLPCALLVSNGVADGAGIASRNGGASHRASDSQSGPLLLWHPSASWVGECGIRTRETERSAGFSVRCLKPLDQLPAPSSPYSEGGKLYGLLVVAGQTETGPTYCY